MILSNHSAKIQQELLGFFSPYYPFYFLLKLLHKKV